MKNLSDLLTGAIDNLKQALNEHGDSITKSDALAIEEAIGLLDGCLLNQKDKSI